MNTVASAIATAIQAHQVCNQPERRQQRLAWMFRLQELENCLPSGSGFDKGCSIIREIGPSRDRLRLKITTAYHHMNSDGFYTGWSDYTVFVRPTFDSIDVYVHGKDVDGIKDHIGESFHAALTMEAPRADWCSLMEQAAIQMGLDAKADKIMERFVFPTREDTDEFAKARIEPSSKE